MSAGTLSLDAFLARRAADQRLARLTHDIGLPEASGLEFGPADNPTPRPDGWRVAYVDHAAEAGAGLASAVALDHVWAGSGSLAAVLGECGFDFAIAAQVAQYVPNLLGWLRGIHAVLRPGGVLNLSLPDKRFMFDATRPVSSLAELVEADLLAYDRPSPRQLFAHACETRAIAPDEIWAGAVPIEAPCMAGMAALTHAHAQVLSAHASGSYVPCHCWVFTPNSFLDRVAEATQLSLFPFVLNHVGMTQPGGFEFFVSMRRNVNEQPDALQVTQQGAIAHLRVIVERQRRTAALLAGD